MSFDAYLAAFLNEGTLRRTLPDVSGATEARLPRRSVRVLERMPDPPKTFGEVDDRSNLRARAVAIQDAERLGDTGPTFGERHLWLVEVGNEQHVYTATREQIDRHFPDADEAKRRARAGIAGGRVPDRLVDLGRVDRAIDIVETEHAIASGLAKSEAALA